MIEVIINSKTYLVDVEPDTPLLWVIRDTLNLTGTKYGCGIQQYGACTVLIKGRPVRSCGYCQSGQILAAVSLLQRNQNPSDQLINRTMNGLCRCGTYPRIKKAIHKAGEIMEKQNA